MTPLGTPTTPPTMGRSRTSEPAALADRAALARRAARMPTAGCARRDRHKKGMSSPEGSEAESEGERGEGWRGEEEEEGDEEEEDDASSLEPDPAESARPVTVPERPRQAPCVPEDLTSEEVEPGVWVHYDSSKPSFAEAAIGTRVPAAEGSLFGVRFEAYLSDGTLVDSNASIAAASSAAVPAMSRADDVFRFRVGRSGVVRGFEVVVQRLRVGEEVFAVVRSDQAFGAAGWRDVVPPFADLSYRVSLVELTPPRRHLSELSVEERMAEAETAYERGNEAFRQSQFRQARLDYETALDALATVRHGARSQRHPPSEGKEDGRADGAAEEGKEEVEDDAAVVERRDELRSKVLSNIVATHEREREWEDVLRTAEEALRAPKALPKVRMRRARAYAHLGDFPKSEADLGELERLGENVEALRTEVRSLQARAREQEKTMYLRMASAFGGQAAPTSKEGATVRKRRGGAVPALYEDRIAEAEQRSRATQRSWGQALVEGVDAVYDATCGNLERLAEVALDAVCHACCSRSKRGAGAKRE
jgi:hypothetical protein